MTNIEKIRQEIERRKKRWMFDDLPISIGRYYEDRDILAFIDSLPEETKDAEQAAARWMENKMPMQEDTVIFQKGVAEGRRMEREELPRWKKGPADSAIRTRDYWPVSNAPMLGKPETRDYFIVKRGESLLLAFHAEEGDYYLSTEELDKIPTE